MSSASGRSAACSRARHSSAILFALLLLPLAPTAARAQSGGGGDLLGNGGKHSIQGRIYLPSGRPADIRLKVRLEIMGEAGITVLAGMDGSFRFNSLKAGSYAVVVEGEQFETARESVYIDQRRARRNDIPDQTARVFNLHIHLRPKVSHGQPRPGVINATLAGVPKPAADLYQKALESARQGDNKKAAEQLRGALEFHPDFALALSELGVVYMKLKQPEKAVEPLRSALKLAPDEYATLLTYGLALYDLQRLPEAEEQFRKALKQNASSPSAHYYLGLILLKRKDFPGAEAELKSAVAAGGDRLPLAHYYLGGLYWGQQRYAEAVGEFETYLRLAPDAPHAARLRETIKELRGKQVGSRK